jgi:hypothetical protein
MIAAGHAEGGTSCGPLAGVQIAQAVSVVRVWKVPVLGTALP